MQQGKCINKLLIPKFLKEEIIFNQIYKLKISSMKKILFTLLIVVLVVSCSKNEPEPEELKTSDPYPELTKLLKEYNLSDKFDNIEKIKIRYNDSFISFSGQLKNSPKIGLVISDTIIKKKFIDIVPFEDNKLTMDKPYEGKVIVTVEEYSAEKVLHTGNDAVLSILINISNSINIPRYYCFIKDGKLVNKIGYYTFDPYTEKGNIIKWRDNYIITGSPYQRYTSLLCNSFGEIITNIKYSEFEFGYTSSFDNILQDEILNDFEAITLSVGDYIRRIDLREKEPLWSLRIDMNKLNYPQINETKFIEKNATHFTYEIYYTEYSGNKGTLKFKVNIETGEIEYL